MSEQPFLIGALPEGRRLESTDRPKGYLGTLRVLPRADTDSVALARRNWPEGRERDFERHAEAWVDKATGTRYLRVRGDPLLALDPAAVGVSVFVVADDAIIYLRKEGEPEPVAERRVLGEVGGRQAGPRDRLPVMPEVGSIW